MKKTKLREGANMQFEALQRLGEELAIIGAHGKAVRVAPQAEYAEVLTERTARRQPLRLSALRPGQVGFAGW